MIVADMTYTPCLLIRMNHNENGYKESVSLSHSLVCLLEYVEHKFWGFLHIISEIGNPSYN